MSRFPLRVRLALAFGLAMAVVITAVGSLLYVRLSGSLLEQMDDNLESLAEGVGPVVRAPGADLETLRISDDETVVQLLGPGERVRGLPEPLVTDDERRRASERTFFLTRAAPARVGGETVRLRLSRIEVNGQTLTLVVGGSLEDRQEALDGLLTQLLVVGPLALLLTSVGGYFLAGAALRPVEAMRRRAADVSSERAHQRLPLPRANDEIRRLGETLNDMLARLEAGLARERRFVADASHEMRTPLTSLRTELELALRRPRSQAELEEALRSAAEEVERVVRLAEDLLVLARADDGRLPLAQEKHIVREVLDAVAGRYDSSAAAVGRSIVVDAESDWILTGDRLRLEQALGNLVDNALRHGGGAIRLEARPIGRVLELRVSDDGVGFPPEFLPHAFERFSRADVARAGSGAGLGLAIVDAIARAHGGKASARNKSEGGAVTAMRIPAEPTAHLSLI